MSQPTLAGSGGINWAASPAPTSEVPVGELALLATADVQDLADRLLTSHGTRKGRARIAVVATLHCDGKPVGRFEGDFVAVAPPAPGAT